MKAIHRSLLIFPFVLFVAAAARVASADPYRPTDSDKAAARPFAVEGLRLAQEGRCREAVDKLERGEALVHAPTTSVPLAQCDVQIGKIVEGSEILNRVINESLPPGVPPSWAEAQQQARAVLQAVTPRIPKLRIHVEVPAGFPSTPVVTVDGQPVPSVLFDNDRPTDPGPHRVTARQDGLGTAEANVSLSEGQVLPVSLRLSASGAPIAPGAVADPYGQNQPVGPPAPGTSPPSYVPPASPPPPETAPGALWMAAEFGVRVADGVPLGGATGGNGNGLSQTISNLPVPLWLDAGVRLRSNWYVGASFSYGLASLSNQAFDSVCQDPGVGCSAHDIRLGANVQYHVLPDGRFDPWFGLGFGYEWASATVTADAAASDTGSALVEHETLRGWEFINFQAGLDFRFLGGALGVGPFLGLTVAQYSDADLPSPGAAGDDGGTTGQSISDKAVHEWFFFGARGTYDLKIQ